MLDNLPSATYPSDNYLKMAYLAKGGTLKEARNLSQDQMDTIYRVGFSYYSSACYPDALIIFKYLSLLDHCNYSYLLGLGSTLKALEQYAEALPIFDCAIEVNKSDPRAYVCKAACMIELKDFSGAADFLPKAKKIAGNSAEWLNEYRQIQRLMALIDNN